MILGRRLTLNPLVIFISLMFWTLALGNSRCVPIYPDADDAENLLRPLQTARADWRIFERVRATVFGHGCVG
jgi:hypothetical protein